jgi:hypothetical protein
MPAFGEGGRTQVDDEMRAKKCVGLIQYYPLRDYINGVAT